MPPKMGGPLASRSSTVCGCLARRSRPSELALRDLCALSCRLLRDLLGDSARDLLRDLSEDLTGCVLRDLAGDLLPSLRRGLRDLLRDLRRSRLPEDLLDGDTERLRLLRGFFL